MGVRELHSTVLILRRRLAQNNAILKQKEDEIHIIEQRVERIKRESKDKVKKLSPETYIIIGETYIIIGGPTLDCIIELNE